MHLTESVMINLITTPVAASDSAIMHTVQWPTTKRLSVTEPIRTVFATPELISSYVIAYSYFNLLKFGGKPIT